MQSTSAQERIGRSKMLPALAVAAIATMTLAALAGAPRAEATEITFDGLPAGPLGTTYVEKGYQFFDTAGLFSWGVGGAHSFDASPGSATLYQGGASPSPHDYVPTILTRVDGGPFDLTSADFSDDENTRDNGYFTYQFVFNFVGGSSIIKILQMDEDFGSQTVQFNYTNLLSVEWGNDYLGNDPYHLQWDNVIVNATPLPPAFPLFVSALGGLCVVGWRRKNHQHFRTGGARPGRS